ncbi:hypothetical protein WJX72_010651 [[Myrmecia] bisecta]|uniref:Phosphate transporter n=1 Tax=[Myrmecia] bisecta TaxID=41462 RepID=A0AAW1QGB5_9CHLO
MDTLAWVFYLSVAVAFAFAFGIGANDVANSFGTSIGSGALTMRKAIVIAAFCEVAGAVTLGAGVSDTILRQISNLDSPEVPGAPVCWACGQPNSRMLIFMLGMACALFSGALFMLVATCAAMPVSTTHAIVGAVLGMTLVGAGAACVRWFGLLTIVASWFISPALAGALSVLCLLATKRCILEGQDPFQRALAGLPFLFAGTVAVSYAHGANDTANAAGPFAAVQALYLHGLDDCGRVTTPFWVLAFCGLGIVTGLALLGHRVMQTVGRDLTSINYPRGFAIELGSTLSVVLASVAGMPVSSTHAQIGSIVAVGMLESGWFDMVVGN